MNDPCGCRLHKVCLVIGWFSLIVALLFGILMSVAFERLDYLVQFVEEQIQISEKDFGIREVVIAAICSYFVLSVVHVITSFFLILGITRELHRLLMPWLISFITYMLVNVALFIYILYVRLVATFKMNTTSPTIALLMIGICLFIQCILWILIFNLYRKIRAAGDEILQTIYNGSQASDYTWR
uniref:Uncharacterized protein n=1 Tax=Stomoxys calcitrans TaxID=35570 RepID=A0A1I8PAI3_STOCA